MGGEFAGPEGALVGGGDAGDGTFEDGGGGGLGGVRVVVSSIGGVG